MLEDPGGGALAALGNVLQRPLSKGDGFIAGPGLPGTDWRHLPALPAKRDLRRAARDAHLTDRQPCPTRSPANPAAVPCVSAA